MTLTAAIAIVTCVSCLAGTITGILVHRSSQRNKHDADVATYTKVQDMLLGVDTKQTELQETVEEIKTTMHQVVVDVAVLRESVAFLKRSYYGKTDG